MKKLIEHYLLPTSNYHDGLLLSPELAKLIKVKMDQCHEEVVQLLKEADKYSPLKLCEWTLAHNYEGTKITEQETVVYTTAKDAHPADRTLLIEQHKRFNIRPINDVYVVESNFAAQKQARINLNDRLKKEKCLN